MPKEKPETENLLLHSLADGGLGALSAHLKPVDLEAGTTLYDLEDEVGYVYFPVRALVSMLSGTEDGELAEVGLIGNEGVVTLSSFFGNDRSAHRYIVQVSGRALRAPVDAVRNFVQSSAERRRKVMHFADYMLVQISQTALCNRLHSVEERLSRWLLISDDRVHGRQLPLTHEVLSHMLGTRRSTVSLTAAVLQQARLIRYQRGVITVLNREGLEAASCPCYRPLVRHYARLLQNLDGR